MSLPPPRDPVAAVTHPDPYPYYAELVAQRPLYRDEGLGLWVASSAQAVTAVLTRDICRVRPPSEPVPRALLGSPAAEIFRHLVRMTDGAPHDAAKYAVASTAQSLDAERMAEESARWARRLVGELPLTTFAFDLSVHVVGSLLGIPSTRLRETAQWMSQFVRCLAPASTPEQVERGKKAAGHLLVLGQQILAEAGESAESLLPVLARQAHRAGVDGTAPVVANGIGFMSQAYEATAGLIGNTLLALAAHPDVREVVTPESTMLHSVVREVLRHDPPVQNTRRFLARSGAVADQEMAEGDAVLVVLAAANRDPLANPRPEAFDVRRPDRRLVTFGVGGRAGARGARAAVIAQAGVAALLASGLDPSALLPRVTYRPSASARIPLFDMIS